MHSSLSIINSKCEQVFFGDMLDLFCERITAAVTAEVMEQE